MTNNTVAVWFHIFTCIRFFFYSYLLVRFTRPPLQRWSLKQGIIRLLGQCAFDKEGREERLPGISSSTVPLQPQGATSPTDSSTAISAEGCLCMRMKCRYTKQSKKKNRDQHHHVWGGSAISMEWRSAIHSGYEEVESLQKSGKSRDIITEGIDSCPEIFVSLQIFCASFSLSAINLGCC